MIDAEKSVYEENYSSSQVLKQNLQDQLEKQGESKGICQAAGMVHRAHALSGATIRIGAVLVDTDEGEKLYLVVETKGSPVYWRSSLL